MKPRAINLSCDLNPDRGGASATFRLVKPNATTVTKTLLTDPQGKAVAQFSLGSQYPHGTYTGKVEIVINGVKISDQKSVVI